MIYTSFEYARPRRTDAKRIYYYFFARAIRQLSSRCTFVREFHGVLVSAIMQTEIFHECVNLRSSSGPGGRGP